MQRMAEELAEGWNGVPDGMERGHASKLRVEQRKGPLMGHELRPEAGTARVSTSEFPSGSSDVHVIRRCVEHPIVAFSRIIVMPCNLIGRMIKYFCKLIN